MKKYVIFDIDGTISNPAARADFAMARQWDHFHSLALDDPPIEAMCHLMEAIDDSTLSIILITGRPEKWRSLTDAWLSIHGLSHIVCEILMRPDDDFTPDGPLKLRLLIEMFGSEESMREAILFVVDDKDSVVETLRGAGLTVLQPAISKY